MTDGLGVAVVLVIKELEGYSLLSWIQEETTGQGGEKESTNTTCSGGCCKEASWPSWAFCVWMALGAYSEAQARWLLWLTCGYKRRSGQVTEEIMGRLRPWMYVWEPHQRQRTEQPKTEMSAARSLSHPGGSLASQMHFPLRSQDLPFLGKCGGGMLMGGPR